MVKFISALRAVKLGLRDVPTIINVTEFESVDKYVHRRYRDFRAIQPGTIIPSPSDFFTACRLWWKDRYRSRAVKQFLRVHPNIAEEYLQHGRVGAMEHEGEVVPLNPVVLHDGMRLRLTNEVVDVKAHRRINHRHKITYARCVLAATKCKFGTPTKTQANRLAVHRFAANLMREHGLRPSDAERILPYVVSMTFVPTEAEVEAEKWLKSAYSKKMIALVPQFRSD